MPRVIENLFQRVYNEENNHNSKNNFNILDDIEHNITDSVNMMFQE